MKKIRILRKYLPQSDSSGQCAELDALLAQLALADSAQGAPPAVRRRVLSAARARLVRHLRPKPIFATLLAGALSALLLLGLAGTGAALVLGRSRLLSIARSTVRSLGLKMSSPGPIAPPAGGDSPAAAAQNSAPALGAGASSVAASSDFFALPYSDPSIANGTETTVRVSIPSSQLIAWGVPSPAKEPDDEVEADLLLGDDGLPQAIRVLPASTTSSSNAEEIYP